jgi:hypothetical protein
MMQDIAAKPDYRRVKPSSKYDSFIAARLILLGLLTNSKVFSVELRLSDTPNLPPLPHRAAKRSG